MIRVLFVDHTPFVGGAQLALAEHIRLLDRDRFTPVVACTATVPALVERHRSAGAAVHHVPLPRLRGWSPLAVPRLLRAAWRLRQLVREERVHVVVANTSRAAYIASLALALSPVPLVWWVRDFDFGRSWFRLLGRIPERIVCVSEAIREFYGGSGPRFRVVVVGSDLYRRLAERSPEDVLRERARLSLSPGDVVIGYMGRLVEGKGAQDLLAAFEAVHRQHPRARLLVVGTGRGQEGDNEAELHRAVELRGLSSLVSFTGYRTDEALYYKLFDVFVLTTRIREAMPTSVIQAMMAGKPVVATATGGTPELVRHGETGLLVPPGDPAALAEALCALLADPARAQRLAEEGRRRAMERHREEVTTEKVARLYEELSRAGGEASRGDRPGIEPGRSGQPRLRMP